MKIKIKTTSHFINVNCSKNYLINFVSKQANSYDGTVTMIKLCNENNMKLQKK